MANVRRMGDPGPRRLILLDANIVIYDYVPLGVIGRDKKVPGSPKVPRTSFMTMSLSALSAETRRYRVPPKVPRTEIQMSIRVEKFCKRCGHIDGPLKVYRDPFGKATAPGRWPTLTMHSDCFLAYIGDRSLVGLLSASR